jgi:hypothetical protein
VRHHAVASPERVLDRSPDVVGGCRLDVPDVTRVAVQLARLNGRSDIVLVADGTTRGVYEPCSLLEVLEKFSVDESTGTFVEGAVDSDDIALRDELLEVNDAASVDGLGGSFRERSIVVVEEFFAVKWSQTLKDTVTDTASTDGTDNLALQVKGVASDVRDLPVTTFDHLVGRNKVPDEEEDGHDNVLSNGHDIGAGDFQNLDFVLDSGVEVNVVRADTSCDTELQVLGLLDQVSCEVPRVEGRSDQDLSINDVLLEVTLRTLLGVRDNIFESLRFEVLADTELVLDRTKETRLFLGGITTFVKDSKGLSHHD